MDHTSSTTAPTYSEKPSSGKPISTWIRTQLEQQAIHFSDQEIDQTTVHYQLLCEHAERIMSFPLPEQIEPAPEFRPLTFSNN